MKALSLCLGFLHLSALLFASGELNISSGRAQSLGGTSVTLSDPYSILSNQAAMAFQKEISFSLYAEQRYLQSELGYYACGLTLPTKSGVFGLAINYNGFDLYNEKRIGLGYGMLFTKNISGGIQIDYLSTSVSEYGSSSTLTFEAGLMIKISKQLAAAAHVFNPVPVNTGFEDEKVPTLFRFGMSYEPGEKILLLAEAEKDIDRPARIKAGLEYQIAEVLHLRGGVATNPSQYSFGAGINVQNLKIDIASTFHQVLGFTPALSVNYVFGKK